MVKWLIFRLRNGRNGFYCLSFLSSFRIAIIPTIKAIKNTIPANHAETVSIWYRILNSIIFISVSSMIFASLISVIGFKIVNLIPYLQYDISLSIFILCLRVQNHNHRIRRIQLASYVYRH